MDFAYSDEQQQLRDAVRVYLRGYPDPKSRGQGDSVRVKERWTSIAKDLGLGGLAVPHKQGGLGGDPVDAMIVMEEFGAALVAEPFVETVIIAGRLIAGSLRGSQADDLQRIADGSHRYALVRACEAPEARLTAHRDGEGWRLQGMASFVLGAPRAERLIVSAVEVHLEDPIERPAIFVVDADAAGIIVDPYQTIDGRCAADLTFVDARLDARGLLHSGHAAVTRLEEALDATRAAQSAEAVGLMRTMLRDTIDYTAGRRQFGKPLADFQVVRHRMADMAMQIETATSALYLGTLGLDASAIERARAISTMAVVTARALRFVAQSAMQLHGGMGMTDELALGHYAKRALAIEQTYGDIEWHLRRFAALRDKA